MGDDGGSWEGGWEVYKVDFYGSNVVVQSVDWASTS